MKKIIDEFENFLEELIQKSYRNGYDEGFVDGKFTKENVK